MTNYCVYLHTSPTNKYYVGITKQNPLKRWANGRGYCKNKHFYNAILKYGWDNFKHEIIFSGITKEEAIQSEKQLIKALNSNDPLFGYNNTEGGETRKSLSKESRLKVSTKNKGKKRSADTRRKIAESKKNKKGNPCSQSRKLALSILMKGNTYAKNLQINKIPIIQLDLNNNVICVWESATFDSIPAYEDGGKKIMPPKELGLTPGTPEYYKRQQQISGKASTVQPEAYITPAGYVKDAINFVEDLSNGDYTGAAVDAALNIIPWGVGKTLKKFKSKVGRLIEGTDEYATSSYAEPFTPTITKPIKAKRTPSGERNYNPAKPPKDIEAQAAMLQDTWYREAVNKNQYSNEILRSVDQALYPDEDTRKLVREIDKAYNTNYEKAYSDIAYKEITGRKDYVSYGSMGDNIYGKANMKNIQDGFTSSNVDDYSIVLDPSTYIPGTANHELGHIADGIAGSIKYEAEPGVDYITNPYLRYLADPGNTYTTKELRDAGFHSAAKNKRYLLNPTESKSHMLTLKRALKDSNKISKWSDPVDENMILDYFRSGKANGAVRNQYDLYIDKQRYIDRLNRLVPMEWLLPTIGLGGAEFLREKQNNKSN